MTLPGPQNRAFKVLCYRLEPGEYRTDNPLHADKISAMLSRDVKEIAENLKTIITVCGASYSSGFLVVTVEWWKR